MDEGDERSQQSEREGEKRSGFVVRGSVVSKEM